MRRRASARLALAVAVLVLFTAVYRFNTLGGALGGFDDDHFVYFAYAKQVQAGEQPLRDFDGLGLQGARPSLSYEIGAAAQSLLGNNFRSEALLTVAGLAMAAALTLYAAVQVSNLAWGLATTVLTVLLAPQLYNYPKVLLLAAAALGAIAYARRRSRGAVAALSGITAAAFLFRHDFAVYVGIAAAVVLGVAAGGRLRAVRHLTLYAALTLLLLAPSLWYVQRHAGLVEYFRAGLDQSANEANRTELRWPAFVSIDEDGQAVTPLTALSVEANAVAWLYYLHMLLPVLALAALLRRDRRDRPAWPRHALVAIALSAVVTYPLLLRGNVGARFGDVGPFTSVLAAGVLVTLKPTRLLLAVPVLAATVAAVWTVGSVRSELDASGWSDSLEKIGDQARRRWTGLARLPAAFWSGEQPSDSLRAAQYLNQCTAPDDRVIIMAYQPELLALADRRFGAGRAAVIPDILSDDAHEQVMLARWRSQRVPIVLTEPEDQYLEDIPPQFALLHAHLESVYVPAGMLRIDGGDQLRVLRDRRLPVVRTFGKDQLPCFR